ncbi:Stk1 family PASTA domain-containing Ser/Thr kinase [Arthrobacter sp. ISL-30]|uniref:Stk1 family PASTA domain-containing Ser/Thr kinase n=1 Tax=Arthrobacter sp. ISL-30 TaxID=2819109 RepID=UPI002034D094|nr:Stk1 family PASTA domain-containing Ser/Thr kinase [Arthrobacter sp. ISL-30]
MTNPPANPAQREDGLKMNDQLVLNGRYQVGELIGRGGMADVHRGTDTLLGRTVAIKLLRADLARDPQFQARFKREAQAVAALNHPAIVAVYDTGEYAVTGGPGENVRVPYIVMEYVSGQTLRDLIKANELGIEHAIDFTLGVLAALEYSHKAGIVHRDIKPGNVMVTGDADGVKVMDFGIARAMADSAATMTQTQAVVGTAQYLSPEQARGETVDARSDLYSAGCMLYEMLTSRPPFVGDSPVSVAYQHVREVPEPASSLNPEVSEALDSVLAKALQKNRADRFQDAAAFRRALRAARNGVPVPALPATEAPTDPNDIPPTTQMADAEDATATMSFAGAALLDEPQSALAGRNGREGTVLADSYAEQDEEELPLGLPPERERSPRQKSRRRAWITTLVIFTLLVLAGGGFWVYSTVNQRPAPVQQIPIPSVTDLTESQALQKLYDSNFKPEIKRLPHDKISKGMAIGTIPGVGTMMDPASAITLNISDGPSTVTIPADLPGRTEAAARDVLRQSGLVGAPSTTFANSPTIPAGSVITTNPAPGSKVPVGSSVEVIVSNGKVPVPQLAGLLVPDAEALLKASGLGMTVVEAVNTQVEPGKVTGQSDAVNSLVEQGKVITVTVAKAPPPSPTPTPTPTTTKPKADGVVEDLFG